MNHSANDPDHAGRLAGQVVVITGAGAGIGRGVALRCAEEAAAHVWCLDQNSGAAEKTAQMVGRRGGHATAAAADVTSQSSVTRVTERILTTHGRIDTLVAFAGIAGTGSATDVDEDEWHRVIDVNLGGTWRSARAVLPAMIEQSRGTIVTMSSITALRGHRAVAAYSASKAGVSGLTRQLAADYAEHGIRVNAIAPGTVPTALVKRMWAAGAGFGAGANDDEQVAKAAATYPLRRVGSPADVASAVVFLGSEDSAWVTGTTVVLDGGKTSII